jgi:PAS domain S-box-containing protein
MSQDRRTPKRQQKPMTHSQVDAGTQPAVNHLPFASDEARYSALVAAIEDSAVFMLDITGVVVTWNLGASKIKGYLAHEIIGQHFSRFYPPEALALGRPAYELAQTIANGRFEDEGWRVRKDGSLFWANVVFTLLRDADGNPCGFAKLTRDLTARRMEEERLRQSEERFRLLVESVNDYAIFMLDPEGRVTTWNNGAITIKGYQPSEIIGRHFSTFYSAEDVANGKPDRELEMATAMGRVEDEGWRVRKDGSTFWANVVITAVRGEKGELRGFAKVTRDMSERKRLEELEKSSRRMSEFLATLGHELRNPLAPVRNAVNVLALEPNLSAAVAGCRDMIDRQISHLTRLVDDLLDVGRITTGKIALRIAPLDIAEVIARSVEAALPFAFQRGQRIEVRPNPQQLFVDGDMTRLVQVVQNLLNNASKFSGPNTRILIEVSVEGRALLLRVADQGRGISANALDTVFQLFVQEDHHLNPSETGLGIGLTLSRSIVELHGGTVSAVSPGIGKGSTFTVRLPLSARLNPEAAGAGPSSGYVSEASTAWRVLVVDDNRDSADSLAMLIQMKGFETRVAYHGVEAVEIAREWLPQLVLVDLAMPVVDGFGVLRAVRGLPGLSNVTMAAMTGYGQQSDRERSIAEGFDVHLVKPVDMATLDDLLVRAEQR